MGILEAEIKELRQLNKDLMVGKVNKDHVDARIAIYSQTEKRARLILAAYATAAKHNKHLNRLIKANLIGDGTAIESQMITNDELEEEQIKCPGMDFKLLHRRECLDFSGERKFEDCQGCEAGLITKKLLLKN